jgi:hypothetical protein
VPTMLLPLTIIHLELAGIELVARVGFQDEVGTVIARSTKRPANLSARAARPD